MELPKLEEVGSSDLNRTETEENGDTSETQIQLLELSIKTNQRIFATLFENVTASPSDAVGQMVMSKVSEIATTIGEQQLTLALLKLLEQCKGSKSNAASKISSWMESEKSGVKL